MRHPKAIAWEEKLKAVFDRVDEYLEDTYGGRYPLHPGRARRGTTANREDDGLFNVGAAFSAGFGSKVGKGYVIEIRMATLSGVPPKVVRRIEGDVVRLLKKELPAAFPGRKLDVVRDGPVYKISGDLGLGEV